MPVREELDRLASRFETRIANSLQRVFDEIRDNLTLIQIEDAFVTGGITGALSLINDLPLRLEADTINELTEAVADSGRISFGLIPDEAILAPFAFNIINPGTTDALRNHSVALVQNINTNTRQAITNALRADIIAGRNPRDTARTFRESIGLTPRQEQSVRNFRGFLQRGDRAAIERRLRDKRFDPTVRRIIAGETVPESKIDEMVEVYRRRSIAHRATTIARTESIRAIQMGNYEMIRQAEEAGRIRPDLKRFWIFTADSRTRAAHRAIPGMNKNGVGPTELFRTPLGSLRYPGDPRGTAANTIQCRCRIAYRLPDEEG